MTTTSRQLLATTLKTSTLVTYSSGVTTTSRQLLATTLITSTLVTYSSGLTTSAARPHDQNSAEPTQYHLLCYGHCHQRVTDTVTNESRTLSPARHGHCHQRVTYTDTSASRTLSPARHGHRHQRITATVTSASRTLTHYRIPDTVISVSRAHHQCQKCI